MEMSNSIHKVLFELSKSNKYEDLLIQCLELLLKRISTVFSFKDDNVSERSKTNDEVHSFHIFESLIGIFDNITHMEVIIAIKKGLMKIKSVNQLEKLFQTNVGQLLNCFNDIYNIYGFISSCCVELKNKKILIYYQILSHKILPCFIIGDLLFIKKGIATNWNTEKVLISSIAKVSKEIYQESSSKLLTTEAQELYFSWIICLDNSLEYLKTRLFIINNSNGNFSDELLGLVKYFKELFYLISRSNLSFYYQILIIINFCESLYIHRLNDNQFFELFKSKSLNKIDLLSRTKENNCFLENIIKMLNKLIKFGMNSQVLEMLIVLNGLSTLLINIIHQGLKKLNNPVSDLDTGLNDSLPINSIKFYCLKVKLEKVKLVVMELHYLKAKLCIPNKLLLEILRYTKFSNKFGLTDNQSYQKVITSYLFLTIGVINSFSKIDLDKNLIFMVNNLLESQCLILEIILNDKLTCDHLFLKNMDSYRASLLDSTVRQIFFLRSKDQNLEMISENCVNKIINILSLFLEIQSNNLQDYSEIEKNAWNSNKIKIKFKTGICEVIVRTIQYTGIVFNELFTCMEEVIEKIFNSVQIESDSNIDEVILNFILSISENLIRLSSQMKLTKNYQDSVKLLNLALKCLSNTLSVPWMITNESINEIEKKMSKLKIFDESPLNNLPKYSTPVKKLNFFQQENNLLINSLELTKNPYSCTRFWKNENENYESVKHKNVNFASIGSNTKFENVLTPFTQKLKSKGLSRLQSQTIKKIQTSALSYLTKNKSKLNKIDGREIFELTQKLSENEAEFPIHILLYLIALDQMISSIQLEFSQEPTQSSLNNILSLVEDKLCILFTLIDHYSYLFIFSNKVIELFPYVEDFYKIIFQENEKSSSNGCDKLIKQYFFSLLSSIIARFAKTKMLLINNYSVDKNILYRYPAVKNERDHIIKIIWFKLELDHYLFYREVSKNYNQIFNKGVINGFCEEIVNVYKMVNKFIDQRPFQLIKLSKINLELYFKNKLELINYYLWLVKSLNNKQIGNNTEKNLKVIYRDEMNRLIDELISSIDGIDLNIKLLYLLKINIYKVYSLFHDNINVTLSKVEISSLLKNKYNKVHTIIEESLDLLYKFLKIHKNYNKNFHNLFNLKYWEVKQLQFRDEVTLTSDKNPDNLKSDNEKLLIEFEDIPIPISNKLKISGKNENPHSLSSSFCQNNHKSNIKSVQFELCKSININQEVPRFLIDEIEIYELGILLYSFYEIQEIITLLGFDSNLLKKLIGAALYLFGPCWTFILFFKRDNLVDTEEVSKKIYNSINEIISELRLSLDNNEEKEMLVLNIGLFISNILYYSAQILENDACSSNESTSRWTSIANIYSDALLFIIESKYLLSSDFLDEKVPIPTQIVEVLLNLIVLKIEHLDGINNAFEYLEIVDKVKVYEIAKDNQSIVGLTIRIINKLSAFFMDLKKPDISLFYLLESNKLVQITISWLETCNISPLSFQQNILSSCISHNFQIYFVNLVILSLSQLGEFWWKLGVVERSQSVFNKLGTFCKNWTIPYKNLLTFYFYQLPVLLNYLFSRSDSQLNLKYSCDNLELFKQIFHGDIGDNNENSSLIYFLKEILEFIEIITYCKNLNDFDEEVLLMMLLFVLIYFSLNNNLSVIKSYFTNRISSIFKNEKQYPSEGQKHKFKQTLRSIINKLLKSNLDSLLLILELFSINLSERLNDKYFTFFFSNVLNYMLTFISSRYTEIIGDYFNKKWSKESNESIAVLGNGFNIDTKFKSKIKKNSIEFIIREICTKIVSVKQILSIELTPIESQLKLTKFTKLKYSNYENKSNDFLIDKDELSSLIEQMDGDKSRLRNRLQIFKQILILVNAIFNHMLLNERMCYYLLNQLSSTIILDIVLLIKALSYPDTSWDTIFCSIINSLTPISLSSEYSFSAIQSIRRIQKSFEYFKNKNKSHSVFDTNFQSSLLKFFLENRNNDISSSIWEEKLSIKKFRDNISMVYIRFSTFFSSFTYKNSNRFKYSILQITRDFSFNGYLNKETQDNENKFRHSTSNLTLFNFVESIHVNKLLEEFDIIQRMNVESIINVDTDSNSSEQARQWWNRRISIESRLNNWLNKFANQVLKGWMTKLFFGWRKELNTEKNIKQLMQFIKTNLVEIDQPLIDIIIFSLTNSVPQVLTLLESNNLIKFDPANIYDQFKRVKLHSIKNKINKFPVIVFLDKILLCLPIESIFDLRFQPITRGVSKRINNNNMDFIINQVQKPIENRFSLLADSCNLYYCINPTGDLEETEKTIVTFIKQKFGSKCSGISNSIPQATIIMNNMNVNRSNLYLFCGHQAGEKFIQGETFEKGIVDEDLYDKDHFHIPPSLLIGCSSSKIRSYGSNNIFFTPMHYLIGGSPLVLGALWDVTDQDIDRFTMSIFDNWTGSKLSLIESITLAKQECKLTLLNGSSCVCFGYPI